MSTINIILLDLTFTENAKRYRKCGKIYILKVIFVNDSGLVYIYLYRASQFIDPLIFLRKCLSRFIALGNVVNFLCFGYSLYDPSSNCQWQWSMGLTPKHFLILMTASDSSWVRIKLYKDRSTHWVDRIPELRFSFAITSAHTCTHPLMNEHIRKFKWLHYNLDMLLVRAVNNQTLLETQFCLRI